MAMMIMIVIMVMDLLEAQRDARAAVTTRAKRGIVITKVIIEVIKMNIRSNLMTRRVRPKVELFRQPCSSSLESRPPKIDIIVIMKITKNLIMIILMIIIINHAAQSSLESRPPELTIVIAMIL